MFGKFRVGLLWAGLAAWGGVQFGLVQKAWSQETSQPIVTPQPDPNADILPFFREWTKTPETEPRLSREETIARLRKKVKYVFVIFHENESFDRFFGTFPGANGLYSDGLHPRAPKDTPGFTQIYENRSNGEMVTVEPLLIGPEQNANVLDGSVHGHDNLTRKLHLAGGTALMDQFASVEYENYAKKGGPEAEAKGKQFARLVMSHVDCDTIPFLWQYASRFVLFDNIFATENTPSTPNALALLAGQSGETEWVRRGAGKETGSQMGAGGPSMKQPIVDDPQPFLGSQFDLTKINRQPRGARQENYRDTNIAETLSYATLMLSFMGREAKNVTAQDLNPEVDLAGIRDDIDELVRRNGDPVAWRWYEEGYDSEAKENAVTDPQGSYVSHHEGPQYFGYIANNPALRDHFRGLGEFFEDMKKGDFPHTGGVFYLRGGYINVAGDVPYVMPGTPQEKADKIKKNFRGDDDHPGYSDHQISEAMAARVINAVVSQPGIWKQSLIIITYDESDGAYDHVPPRILSFGPDGQPLARGSRVPLIVISPYARVHAVSHAEGDHNAVIETINAIFDLPELASLPDEAQALRLGRASAFNGPDGFVQNYLGPRDQNSPITDDLLSAFDSRRLLGTAPALPPTYAAIAEEVVNRFPHYGGQGCKTLDIVTEDRRQGIRNVIPQGFNSLPATYPPDN